MSDYSFDFRERYAVFTVFDGKCPWCNAPVLYTSFQVDHIIPERLLDDQLELDRLKAMYNLPNDFNINNYENWVPAHPRCNLEKSGKVFENLLTIKLTLDRCAKGKEQARRIEEILRKEPQKAELLTKVQAAIEANLLNIQELQNFLLKTDMINSNNGAIRRLRQQFEGDVNYQAQQSVTRIMDLVKSTANDAVNEMIAEWGPSWRRPFIAMMEGHPEDNQYNFTWYLENFSRPELNVNIITMPNVVNNQVVIRFRIGQEMIGQFIREVDKMDYSAFKDEFFNLYATQIEAKLNKLS